MTRRGFAVGMSLLTACTSGDARRADSIAATFDASAAPQPAHATNDSATVASAVSTLARYLDGSRQNAADWSGSRASRGGLTCDSSAVSAVTAAGPILAAYELLSPLARGDTIVGRAVVTTVADQDVDRRHPGYFVARLRVRADTLEWDIVPVGDGGWRVCNGLSFGLTAPDSLTTWRPAGASLAAARALADSVATAVAAAASTR